MSEDEKLQRLTEYLRDANRLLIFTGAGISTGSGIPDYRGPQGIWKTRQPVLYQDFMTSRAARNTYWQQKHEDWQAFRDARPNAVHDAAVLLQNADKLVGIVTQNIDGLHELAGAQQDLLVELHGSNRKIACQSCDARSDPEAHFADFGRTGKAPLCACGGYLKPATISFGQSLVQDDLQRAADMAANADCVLAMGSTLSVYPAAGIPLLAANRAVPYIIINSGATEHDSEAALSLRIEADVLDIFPAAVHAALTR